MVWGTAESYRVMFTVSCADVQIMLEKVVQPFGY